jgi:uncharacterized protein (TIGR00661 family)
MKQPQILVCPLDWGLGHATRCIPVINELLRQGAEVIIGADKFPKALLRDQFPDLRIVTLPGPEIIYPTNNISGIFTLRTLFPFTRGIIQEKKHFKKLARTLDIDGVISDNRYGLHHKGIPSVLITHQLNLQVPAVFQPVKPVLNSMIGFFARRFNHTWIPDFPGPQNLSGHLGHRSLPGNHRFVGALSRYHQAIPFNNKEFKSIDVLVILSGPEPQRSQLERNVLQQSVNFEGNVTIVRGKPGEQHLPEVPKNVAVFNHASDQDMIQLIGDSKIIVARAGYSTIMDLVALRQPAILIPTPGQTEQEYLARHLANHPLFTFVSQKLFSLSQLRAKTADEYHHDFMHEKLLANAVSSFMDAVGDKKVAKT